MGLAYTYSEPVVHYEYVMDTAALAREAGLKNVLITAGYLSPGPARSLLALMDASNVDFKSWSAEFYRQEIGGDIEAVKRFLALAAALTHLEVTTLIIPNRNDSEEEMRAMAAFLADLGQDIPYHLSAYYPAHRYFVPPTSVETVTRLARVAAQRLNYVYIGNVSGQDNNTRCSNCDSVLVRRSGYRTAVVGVHDGRCQNCGARAPLRLS